MIETHKNPRIITFTNPSMSLNNSVNYKGKSKECINFLSVKTELVTLYHVKINAF